MSEIIVEARLETGDDFDLRIGQEMELMLLPLFRSADGETLHTYAFHPLSILESGMISDPLTRLMFCSPAEGGAALVLASEKKAKELGRAGIRIAGASVRARVDGSFEPVGASGLRQVYENVVQMRGAAGARRFESRSALPTARFTERPDCRRSAFFGATEQGRIRRLCGRTAGSEHSP